MKVVVIYGSVREGRQGIKAARFIVNKLGERGHEVSFVDPLEYDFPLLEKRFREYTNPPAKLKELSDIIKASDGIVVVSAEYNHLPPPALLNIMDYFGVEYARKPSAIVSYSDGPFGGLRAAVHLKDFLGEIGTVPIPTVFPVSAVQSGFDEKGITIDKSYDIRIMKFLDEFEWYMKVLKHGRENYPMP
jgi:NAD(P)H-dependent FMN reductase